MAALVYFAKVAERPGSVRYAFGDAPGHMTRHLSVDTATRHSMPEDGRADYTYLKASRKINSLYAERKQWPERGMSVS
ncbi:hypothetical protein [Streptomyces sp. NBC_00083]|uniref:hypothetical protein n=1 Tax=Streptomyces sp. NBC_00083 TaxID=2975647 RepID=UPI00224D94BA|nr:hypothetical protein [Streptomyces sp. NBC_00083]MCX5384878.1 hypothetical protein [Streptomyces sp. NBC_00083]